jgi:hypothetical protein
VAGANVLIAVDSVVSRDDYRGSILRLTLVLSAWSDGGCGWSRGRQVLSEYEIPFPTSALEMDLEPLM